MILDTHTLIWAMLSPEHLSHDAETALNTVTNRSISSVSLYEIALKGSLGKWPEVEGLLKMNLDEELAAQGINVLPANGAIMQLAGGFDWVHRDPFDRIIVATAMYHNLAVISKDKTLDTIEWREWNRIW